MDKEPSDPRLKRQPGEYILSPDGRAFKVLNHNEAIIVQGEVVSTDT